MNVQNKSLENIAEFLSYYKEEKDISKLDKDFIESSVFSKERQIPDLWLKTKCPINKNLAFQLNCYQKKSSKKIPPNFFPKYPIQLASFCELNSSSQREEKFPLNDMINKSWTVSLSHYNKTLSYGPMNTFKLYTFLKNVYSKMPSEEKDKKTIMIVDVLQDVHYQPENLLQLLDDEYKKLKLN